MKLHCYEILTGELPFQGRTAEKLYYQILRLDPARPSRRRRGVGRDSETLCLKALEKRKERRYASALEFAEDLGRVRRGEPILARPPSFFHRLRERLRSRIGLLAAAAATVLVGVTGFLAVSAIRKSRHVQRLETTAAQTDERARSREEALRLTEQARPSLLRASELLDRKDSTADDVALHSRTAQPLLEEATRKAPDLAMAHYLLGQVRDLSGEWDRAESCRRRSVELDPRLGPAHFQLGRLLVYRACLDVISLEELRPRFEPKIQAAIQSLETALRE